jgi:hypothetical protein
MISVLEYLIEVAQANSLETTASAQKLGQARSELENLTPTTNLDHIMFCDRFAVQSAHDRIKTFESSLQQIGSLDPPPKGSEVTLREGLEDNQKKLVSATIMSVPIFNVWDSISLIYTLCVEDIMDDLRAELHLFQFRMMVQIMSQLWYAQGYSPSTAAATWSASPTARRKIAFATTCSGELSQKREMQRMRYAFAQTLATGLLMFRTSTLTVLRFYEPGNCPEWITIIYVSWNSPGPYSSVCYNNRADRIYKFCGYCEELGKYLTTMDILVNDLWDRSQLGIGDVVVKDPTEGFSYRNLMQYDEIKKKFKGLGGVR